MAVINEIPTSLPTSLAESLDFILSHFNQAKLFPRKIATKTSQGKQFTVYSRDEALAKFNQANRLDCRISAYHATDWRPGLDKLITPDFLFADLDLGIFHTVQALELALANTLRRIKEKLGGFPSVIWSGNGYHVYQPVEAFPLEEQDVFSKFTQPSRSLIRYAERYLTDGKMDQCHNHTMSLKNCMLRIPLSYNSKSNPPKQVKIIQQWDGKRPKVEPLLYGAYIYMQGLRVKEILQRQKYGNKYQKYYHHNGKFCRYWRLT